jgi:sugar lactone lactonase YvrE
VRRPAKAPSTQPERFSKRLRRGLGLAMLAVSLMLVFGSAQALAIDQAYVEAGSFGSGPGSGDGELNHPRRIALNDASGDVYVVDRDNDRIVVFRPAGGSTIYLTQFGAAQLDAPFGVAIDQSDGSVYVSSAGDGKIVKFDSDGAATPAFTPDPTFTSPALGGGAAQLGGFESDLAVDPTSGDLLVADPVNDEVKRYDSDGNHLANFDGSSSPGGAFEGLLDIDVGPSGDVFAVDANGPLFIEGEEWGGSGPCIGNAYCNTDNTSRTLRFDPDGGNGTTIVPPGEGPYGLVALDPNNSQLLVGKINPQSATVDAYRLDGSGRIAGFSIIQAPITGIVAGDTPPRAYMATDMVYQQKVGFDFGQMQIEAYRPVNFPSVGEVTVSAVDADSAHLSASANPNGEPTKVAFEYERGSGWNSLPTQSIGDGNSPVSLEADLTGLAPNVEYKVRLHARNEAGAEANSPEAGFTTAASAPFAYTGGAAPRTETTARINGWVNPRNKETTYYFEFGETAAYGTALPASPASAGSGEAQLAVSQALQGLTPGATYHFRLVAENGTGTTVGADQQFTTRTAAEAGPPQRGIELVNNPDKGNQLARVPVEGPIANSTATKILWTTTGGLPGGTTGTGNIFMAERTADGWRSKNLLPPASQLVDRGESAYKPKLANANFDTFFYEISSGILTSPPRTFATMNTSFSQKVFGRTGPTTIGANMIRANDDFSHVFTNAIADDGDGTEQIFDFATDPPTLVSILPNGQQSCGVIYTGGGTAQWVGRGYEWVATDPSAPGRAFFEVQASCTQGGPAGRQGTQLYMREVESETTTLISGPALPGGPQAEDGMFIRANDDASQAIFVSTSRLAPEDQNDVGDIYRYTLGSGPKCLTCVGAGADIAVNSEQSRRIIVSNDLSRVYFLSRNLLVPGVGERGVISIYEWHQGRIDYVAPVGEQAHFNFALGGAELTGGDRVLFFLGESGITTDELGGTIQAFRYSESDHSIECVSCVPGHVPTSGISRVGANVGESGFGLTTGRGDAVVYETTDALSPRDVNRDTDIYEWRNGRVALVTDGVTQYPAGVGMLHLYGMGSDGDNVVFGAGVNLTGYERDGVAQIYVARAGGGFPPPPGEPAPCGEESCQGPLRPGAVALAPASAAFSGAGNVREAQQKPRKRCVKPRGRKAPKSSKGRKCASKRGANKKRADNNKRGGK